MAALIERNAGHATVRSHLRVLGTRLRSNPDTEALAAPVDAARVALAARIAEWEDAHDERVAATGAVWFYDHLEDEAVAAVAREAKVEVAGKLRAPWYVRLFASSPRELTRGIASETQRRLVEHLIATIGEGDDYAVLGEPLVALVAAHAELEAAVAERRRRQIAEAAAWTEVVLAMAHGRAVFAEARPRLQLLFPGQQRRVDSFFPPQRANRGRQSRR